MSKIDPFLGEEGVFLDVRSPVEYAQGHLPKAFNLPLFSDAERATIGTLYKQVGQKEAFQQGLSFVQPNLSYFIDQARTYVGNLRAKVYCARGGMRSQALATLLQVAGVPAITLSGGYKQYRRWVLKTCQRPWKICIIGGMTGTGKTAVIASLKALGEQVLDLEGLAHHKGSSYGKGAATEAQPTTQQFQNTIADTIASFDPDKTLWIEDESRQIGRCMLPEDLYASMQQAEIFVIERPLLWRLKMIHKQYRTLSLESLIESTEKIRKKLGHEATDEVIYALKTGAYQAAATRVLAYYDKVYTYTLQKRGVSITRIPFQEESPETVAHTLTSYVGV